MLMSVKSGRWSDPSVWNSAVPTSGIVGMMHIQPGHHIIMDNTNPNVIFKSIMSEMGSRLIWDTTAETFLRADTLMLKGITEIGDDYDHEVIFHATEAPGAGMGLGAVFLGPTRLLGKSKKGHLRSADMSIPAGTTTIRLPGATAGGWKVGDDLLIVGSEYVLPATTDPQYTGPTQHYLNISTSPQLQLHNEFQFGQDEQRKIVSISTDDVVTVDSPLAYSHTGMSGTLPHGEPVSIYPVVGNLTRSIRFRSASAAEDAAIDPGADLTVLQKRAHMMVMRQPDVDFRYVELKNMGRTSTDPTLIVAGLPYSVYRSGGMTTADKLLSAAGGTPLENPINVRGRYAFHLHECGNTRSTPMIPVIGLSAYAPVGEVPIPGWAMTQHGTHAALEDCVISNVRGAGMVSELGNELGQWVENLVTGVRGDGSLNRWSYRSEIYSNHNGSVGVAYENQSRMIKTHGNIAGSAKYAFLWHAQRDNKWLRSPRDVDAPFIDGMVRGASTTGEFWLDEYLGHHVPQIPPMLDNEAWACRIGFSVIHRVSGSTFMTQGDKTPMLMEGFYCVNTPFPWEVEEYSNTYYVKDFMFTGPANMKGSSNAIVMGPVSWDWNFSNGLVKNYKTLAGGGTILNYEGFIIDVATEDVTNTEVESWVTFTNPMAHQAKDVMEPWVVDPQNSNRVRVRVHKSIPSSSLPQSYPLEPYGKKLPANDPQGNPYPPVNPGDVPYFVPDAANSTTLTAGTGRGKGLFSGVIRDSVGDRRYPDFQSAETFPSNMSIKGPRTFKVMTPEQVVERWGCWNDNGTWKARTWFFGADRFTHVRFQFHADWTLAGFDDDFLAAHTVAPNPPAPPWPDHLTIVAAPSSPAPVVREPKMLSRTRIEVVSDATLNHRVRPDEVLTRLAIVGGADATHFQITGQDLQWASNGTKAIGSPADANGDNVYEVIIRATDTWGNAVDALHQVRVVSATGLVSVVDDSFDRADQLLTATSSYKLLLGDANTLAVKGNALISNNATTTIVQMGNLGTSEQRVSIQITGPSTVNPGGYVILRMEDADNWLGFGVGGYTGKLRLVMCKANQLSTLAEYTTSGLTKWVFTVQGDTVNVTTQGSVTLEPKIIFPSALVHPECKIITLDQMQDIYAKVSLPADAPRGVNVGIRSNATATTSFMDGFKAEAL